MFARNTLIAATLAVVASPAFAAVTVTSWNFDELPVAINNAPTPTTGAGTASPLGMTNSFTTPPSVTTADVLNNAGSTTPSRAWRIRSAGTGNGNGWAAAALYSQGAQFLASTAGFQAITLTYDWSPTTQGVKHQQVQYTADGSTWTNVGPLAVGPAAEGWVNNISIDLSSISAVNDNPLFGIRIVSAYAPTGVNAGQYVNLAGNVINSTSGNWRLDSINISGTVIPEPSSLGLLAAALPLLTRRRSN